jgi:hypothetical protein
MGHTPTYGVTLDWSNATLEYGGNVEGGTGIELLTNDRLTMIDNFQLQP